MLTSLCVRDVVLIEAADLELGPGLIALTGETGAGKSILLDALGLALGGRGESGLVRSGAAAASVSADFNPPPGHPARALLLLQGLEAEGPIHVRRQLKADGGGRAFLQDTAVGVSLLRELGGLLVEVHGQHDERGLLAPRGHRALLDQFGGHDALLAATAAAHADWRAAAAAEAEHARRAAEAERERDDLAAAVEELSRLRPQPGEEEELAALRSTMQKGARLTEDLSAVAELFAGSDGALAQLRQAARRLERIAEVHPALAEALEALDRALGESHEAEARLDAAAEALAFDPARLEAAEARLFDLRGAARKYRLEVDALPAYAADCAARLEALEEGGAGARRLAAATAAARLAYASAADALTAARHAAAERLAAAVAAELAPLKLDAARLRVALAPLPEAQWGADGAERAEFEIATNAGAPFGPLMRVASGGELSRLMLAMKVALAGTRSAATLIFDEIDRGVGGGVASAIGARLARLGTAAQVLVVTHAPQVAAAASAQLRIAKTGGRTTIEPLGESARREEIARMLSGETVTAEARAQADRLLGREAGLLL